MSNLTNYHFDKLVADIKNLINSTRVKTQDLVARELVLTYWEIGHRIEREKLNNNSSSYASTLKEISDEVNIDPSILRRTITFFNTYPRGFGQKDDLLSWSHYKSLISVKSDALRIDLEKKAKKEKWGRNKLIEAIKNYKSEATQTPYSKLKRPTDPSYLYKAKITRVIDGDTLMLNIDLGFQVIKEQRLRLNSIDAPELKTKEGKQAFDFLKDLVSKLDSIIVKTNKIDIYGRYLGDIFYPAFETNKKLNQNEVFKNGIHLNEELIKSNLVKAL